VHVRSAVEGAHFKSLRTSSALRFVERKSLPLSLALLAPCSLDCPTCCTCPTIAADASLKLAPHAPFALLPYCHLKHYLPYCHYSPYSYAICSTAMTCPTPTCTAVTNIHMSPITITQYHIEWPSCHPSLTRWCKLHLRPLLRCMLVQPLRT
jgi:hypothetical protein